MNKEQQIIEIKECIDAVYGADCAYYDVDGFAIANEIYNADYRKQEWISVNERFPPKNEMVLIFCGGARELDWICSTGLWYDHDYTLVTHWMHLPEPPETKGETE